MSLGKKLASLKDKIRAQAEVRAETKVEKTVEKKKKL